MNVKYLIIFIVLAIAGSCYLLYRRHQPTNMENQKVTQFPEVEEYFSRGWAKQSADDYAGAIEEYSRAIERAEQLGTPESVLYSTRAEAKQELEDYQGAIEDYTRAIKLEPNKLLLYWKCAEARKQVKDYAGALEDLTKAISLSSGLSLGTSYSARAEIKRILGDEAGAKEDEAKAKEFMVGLE